ncbi:MULTISPECIES: hypothetical protein [Lactobacillus]|uniref:hypothetical protein n=1 Tax=Lactobacillus TaxID=1578 RepID=UPI001C6A16B7|nr:MULTISPECIES: hypothetical protein [Lactobacillus]MCX8721514.1 hypothetical protein [Lactobacillus sp. B4010]MCX8733281.1 hypothetical protein [Lactobacillus sp. B4015]MCX8735402.1 hypothetical protein [Lactobacillus sp. B4012]QYN56953.1 hypothetical protein GYM69_07385 [Lactobacillus panisapium]
MQEENAKKLQLFQKSAFTLEKAKNSMTILTLSLFIILHFVAAATDLNRTF